MESAHQPLIRQRSEHPISRRQIDPDALKVLYRLRQHGRIAYLVGGGVRDLLLGQQPKDFDVVTDAHPGEVKRIFRNAWIIGRRFKLVHVVFGRKVIEVATFRAKSEISEPEQAPADDVSGNGSDPRPGREGAAPALLQTRENTFGTPEEDARRRDFTINGLFYDIDSYALIDYVGGLEDLAHRVVRTIGDPDVRFQEDPVRMMRAIKFAARLRFDLAPSTEAALRRHVAAIAWSAPPRVLEEIYRLLGSGSARASFALLHETGLLAHLIPEVDALLASGNSAVLTHLAELDALIGAGDEAVSRPVQMATLLLPLLARPALEAGPGADAPGESVESILRPLAQRLRLTRADGARIHQMILAQRRFAAPRGRRFRPSSFVRRSFFADAFQLWRIHVAATGQDPDSVARWRQRIAEAMGETTGQDGQAAEVRPRRRRRRRRSRRRSA